MRESSVRPLPELGCSGHGSAFPAFPPSFTRLSCFWECSKPASPAFSSIQGATKCPPNKFLPFLSRTVLGFVVVFFILLCVVYSVLCNP